MHTIIGLDIGGTRVSAALVRLDGCVLNVARESTPERGGDALELLFELVCDLRQTTKAAAAPPAGIGIGFGGPVDFAAQTIVRSHHVEGWEPGLPLARLFAERFGLPVLLDNDANCGGLGETRFGAARGYRNVLYVNIGTGIGGAVILDGKIHHGAHSTAGEIGHAVVLPDGPVCTCDKHGCLETLSSGSALAREGRAAGMGEVSGREVGERALAGEPVAVGIVEQAARWLGLALGNAANLLDPEIIVLGGGVPELGEVFLRPAREGYRATAMPAAADTPVVAAALGYDAGVVGAAALMI